MFAPIRTEYSIKKPEKLGFSGLIKLKKL